MMMFYIEYYTVQHFDWPNSHLDAFYENLFWQTHSGLSILLLYLSCKFKSFWDLMRFYRLPVRQSTTGRCLIAVGRKLQIKNKNKHSIIKNLNQCILCPILLFLLKFLLFSRISKAIIFKINWFDRWSINSFARFFWNERNRLAIEYLIDHLTKKRIQETGAQMESKKKLRGKINKRTKRALQ